MSQNQPSSTPASEENRPGAEPAPRPTGLFIGRFLGIPVYLHYSWFLIVAILVWLLSTQFFPVVMEEITPSAAWTAGAIAALLFFLSILLHELGHSVVSIRHGIPVPRITLLFIGGIAEISREPDDPATELKIALGGPLVTLVLVFLYGAIAVLLALVGFEVAALVFQWLAIVNFALLAFNALPGYPLDGGRVLRALIWMRQGSYRKATMITSRMGVGLSFALMIGGVFLLLAGQWQALVLFIIGIFLKGAAESGYTQAVYRDALADATVSDVMSENPISIPGHTPLNLVVDDYFLNCHHSAYPVCDSDGRFLAILRLDYLKQCSREKWPFTTAADLAADAGGGELWIEPDTPANAALRRISRPGHGRLAVVKGGRLEGIITRHDLMQYIEIKTELEEVPNTR